MVTDGAGRDLTDVEAALGRMVYTASTVEVVARMIGEMYAASEQDHEGVLRGTAGTLMKKVKKIVSACGDLTDQERVAFATIVADVSPLLERRNDYIHGGWAELEGALTVINQRVDGVRTRPLAAAELETLSQELTGITNRMMEWLSPVLQRRHPEVITDEVPA